MTERGILAWIVLGPLEVLGREFDLTLSHQHPGEVVKPPQLGHDLKARPQCARTHQSDMSTDGPPCSQVRAFCSTFIPIRSSSHSSPSNNAEFHRPEYVAIKTPPGLRRGCSQSSDCRDDVCGRCVNTEMAQIRSNEPGSRPSGGPWADFQTCSGGESCPASTRCLGDRCRHPRTRPLLPQRESGEASDRLHSRSRALGALETTSQEGAGGAGQTWCRLPNRS